MFPLRKVFKLRDDISLFLFNFALEYAIRSVRVSQDDLSLNGTYQILVYADDVNILCGNIRTVEKHRSFDSR